MHYYIQRGFSIEYILNLSYEERLFFAVSAEMEIERQEKLMKGGIHFG